jgi:Ca2+-binding RTX toxin-like protein
MRVAKGPVEQADHSPGTSDWSCVMSSTLFENLESRKLMSACTLKGGVLNVDGTDQRDVITVKQVSATATASAKVCVTVNGYSQSFTAKKVKSINITARNGSDTIKVTGAVRANSCVNAGGGHDRVSIATTTTECYWDTTTVTQANSCTNTVYGGKGNDTITTTTESLVCYGGEGDDYITSDGGTDCIWGQGGDDYIDSGWSDDVVDCGEGDDQVVSGEGDDFIECSWGDDVVDTGYGDDEVNGGYGDDQIDCGYGDDEVDAGEGDDSVDCGYGEDYVIGIDYDEYVCGYSFTGYFEFTWVEETVCWF